MPSLALARISRAVCALACGGGAAVAVASCGHQAVLAPGHRLIIALMEYRVRPNHIVVPDGHLRITVENYGRLTHNLVIARSTPTTTVAGRAPDLPPGQSTTITVALAPGRYGISSSVGADDALGAQGTLTVVSK